MYECYDQHAAALTARREQIRLVQDERRLLDSVDAVIATSEGLLREKEKYHSYVLHMPNAADVRFFAQVLDDSTQVAPQVADLADQPVIGYLGTINQQTDIALLCEVARRRPEWQLLLVGPVRQEGLARQHDFLRLESLPNVRFAGWVDAEALLGYCRVFDVGIIPYRVDSHFNAFVTPNKLFEYLAMGLPVVSVDLPGLGEYRKYAHIAKTPEDFIARIEAALKGTRLPAASLGEISWENRANLAAQFVRERLHATVEPDRHGG